MKKSIIEKEKNELHKMVDAIKKINEVDSDIDWKLEKFRAYSIAANLAIKIMLQELGVRATKKRIEFVSKELEEGNFHCPVEAIFNIEEEITAEYPVKVWHDDDETSKEHYIKEVKSILEDYSLVICA